MKKYLLLVFLFLLAGKIFSQEIHPTIRVTGNAVINIKPDIMKWEISVDVYSDNVMEGKNDNDKATGKVLDYLKSVGIPEKDINTQGIRITKNIYDYKDTKKFTITNVIWFSLTQFSLYDDMTTELTKIDNVYIKNINLDYSKSIELRSKARTDALLAASVKANDMASVLGATVGKPLVIEEGSTNYYYPNPYNNVSYNYYGSEGNSQLFYEGMIKVEASVSVTFELINK